MSVLPEQEPARDAVAGLRRNIDRVFIGDQGVVTCLLVGLLSEGHVLIEDVPGVGKTTLAQALARSIDCSFRRIQFTPDLLPSDILGVSLYDPDRRTFVFRKGPLFANIILADEINRTPPRTQSALLEAMGEYQVSVEGESRRLDLPFMVLATMNPVEHRGTYHLPESELDRFLLRLRIGYPGRKGERMILRSQRQARPLEDIEPVIRGEDVLSLQQRVREVGVDASLEDYGLSIVEATREHPEVELGASPRASLDLFRAAQAHAFLEGRDHVVPDDLKAMVRPALAHRLVLQSDMGSDNLRVDVLRDILERTAVPS